MPGTQVSTLVGRAQPPQSLCTVAWVPRYDPDRLRELALLLSLDMAATAAPLACPLVPPGLT